MTKRVQSAKKELVVLISGNGSNMCAILHAINHGVIHADVATVISNQVAAGGLSKATELGVATRIIEQKQFTSTAAYGAALCNQLKQIAPDLIVLAGFMHILSANLVHHFAGKILNIHPSLLPQYKGLHTHQRVLEANEPQHGCSVHFVTETLDDGPIIMQAKVDVLDDDTPQTLAARVLKNEHIIYPKTIALYCDDRLRLRDGVCLLDNQPLKHPLSAEAAGS